MSFDNPTRRSLRFEIVDKADRVTGFLIDHPGQFYCNSCLSEALPLLNVAQVNTVIVRLRGVVPYRIGTMICVHCRADRKCVAYGSDPKASPSPSY